MYSRDQLKLDFKWLDLGEKDDRTITEILNDMQSKSAAITDAVAKLQEILGGVDLRLIRKHYGKKSLTSLSEAS